MLTIFVMPKLRLTGFFLLLGSLFLLGCQTLPNEAEATAQKGSYCLNGSKENNYSCDPEKASTPETPPTYLSEEPPAELDEVWMYTKLAEVRAWLTQQKQTLAASEASASDATWQTLQLGSFKQSDNASRLQQHLLEKGYEPFTRHKGQMTVVYVGREVNAAHLELLQSVLLEEFNLFGRIVDFPDQ